MARVLILEPEPDLRMLAQEALLELGHEPLLGDCSTACSEADVLLSAVFPGASEVIDRLRGRRPSLPIVLVGTRPGCARAHGLRPDQYLLQPYKLAELDRALRNALDRTAR